MAESLKDMLANAEIVTDGTSVRIKCEGFAERENLASRLTEIATVGDTNGPVTQVVLVKAVIVYDDDGNCMIHGSSKDEPEVLFKEIAPDLWTFNPLKEAVHAIELEFEVPRVDSAMKPKVL